MPARHIVAKASDIPVGGKLGVSAGGRSIALFNVAGEFYALANVCPHEGGPLCEGFVTGIALSNGPNDYRIARKGEFVRCPWHGWEFDIKTGKSFCDPNSVRARQFRVDVAPGEELIADGELVEGPFAAETIAVDREGDYLVIEI